MNIIAVLQSRIWGICDTKEITFEESKQENFTPKKKKRVLFWALQTTLSLLKELNMGSAFEKKSDERHRIMKNDLKFKKLKIV